MTAIVAAILCAVAVVGQNATAPSEAQVKVRIQSVDRNRENRVVFHVRITNLSSVSVYLERDRPREGGPYALDIEKWEDGEGWLYVGPLRDIPPEGIIRLAPSESLEADVVVIDPRPRLPQRGYIYISGKHRASIDYFLSMKSAEWFKKRGEKRNRKGYLEAVSEPVWVPAKGDWRQPR